MYRLAPLLKVQGDRLVPQPTIGAPRVQEAARARSTHPTDPPISTRMGFVYADPLPTATELQGSLPVDELPLEKHHHGPYELDRLLNAQKQESRLQEPPELTGIPAPCIIRTLQPFLWFPELHTPPCSSCCWREMASPPSRTGTTFPRVPTHTGPAGALRTWT